MDVMSAGFGTTAAVEESGEWAAAVRAIFADIVECYPEQESLIC